jgi:hypothetical protein
MILTDILFYKIYTQQVSVEDYINWACDSLINDIVTENICIISSFAKSDSLFEVESYFHKALDELGIEQPSFESCSKSYIKYLAQGILDGKEDIFELAYKIYKIVAELDFPEELNEWYELSEMIDAVTYNTFYNEYFTKDDVEQRIIEQAQIEVEV